MMKSKNKKEFGMLQTFHRVVIQHIPTWILMLIVIAGAIITGLLPPLILEYIANKISQLQSISLLLVFLYFGMLVISGLFNSAKEIMITKFGQKITRMLRFQMCEKLNTLSAAYFTRQSVGELVSLFVNDVDTIQLLFSNGVISMVISLFQIISILAVIYVKSKGLGLIMLIVVPVIFLMTRVFQKRMLVAQLKNRSAFAKVSNHIPETIRSIRTVQNLMKQKFMEDRYDGYITQSYEAVEHSNVYDSIYSPIILTISAVVVGTVMIFSSMGGELRELFGMQVGTAVAIIAYVGKVFEPIESLGMEIQNIQEAFAGVKRVKVFMNEEEMQPKELTINQQDMNHQADSQNCVEVKHIDFGYQEEKILTDKSLKIRTGENVTLMGRTGCGKSTILKLILGLYSPDQGEVLVYGKNADQIADNCKRKLFGYVEQSFPMILGTVEDQITLKDASITREQVEAAAKMVGMHDWIMELKNGYDTICDDKIFSQGQLQLLSIARAIVENPSILLLDEITANLDAGTEQKVLTAIEKAGEDRTVISVSHRIYEKNGNSRLIEI